MFSKLRRIKKIGLAIAFILMMSGLLLFEGNIQALPCCSCSDEELYCQDMGMVYVSGMLRACSGCSGDPPGASWSCHQIVCY